MTEKLWLAKSSCNKNKEHSKDENEQIMVIWCFTAVYCVYTGLHWFYFQWKGLFTSHHYNCFQYVHTDPDPWFKRHSLSCTYCRYFCAFFCFLHWNSGIYFIFKIKHTGSKHSEEKCLLKLEPFFKSRCCKIALVPYLIALVPWILRGQLRQFLPALKMA